jgi:PAS domain S-box-containing protein
MTSPIDMTELVEAVGDAIVACDGAGMITVWNKAAQRIFGFSAQEAMGASLDIIIPERMKDRHWEGYHKTMETGVTKYGSDVLSVPAIDKQGRTLSMSFTVAMLFDADGKATQCVAVMRDDTARYNRDRALRKRIAELEANQDGSGATSAVFPDPPQGCPMSGAASENYAASIGSIGAPTRGGDPSTRSSKDG